MPFNLPDQRAGYGIHYRALDLLIPLLTGGGRLGT